MQEKTRLAIKLMDGVKLNEEKYAKPKKEVEKPLNDVEEVISVDIPAGQDPSEALEELMKKEKDGNTADEVNSNGSKSKRKRKSQNQEENRPVSADMVNLKSEVFKKATAKNIERVSMTGLTP